MTNDVDLTKARGTVGKRIIKFCENATVQFVERIRTEKASRLVGTRESEKESWSEQSMILYSLNAFIRFLGECARTSLG